MTDDESSQPRLASLRGIDGAVYEPAEDSALLAHAVVEEIEPGAVVLDVGTGSGYVGYKIQEKADAAVVGIDINPYACKRATEAGLTVIRGDLTSGIQTHGADVIVCNPPYLPTEDDPFDDDWLERAIAGGPQGRDIVNRLLADAGRVLTPEGELFLLVSSLQDIETVRDRAATEGFRGTEIARDDSFPFEVLAVYRFSRCR